MHVFIRTLQFCLLLLPSPPQPVWVSAPLDVWDQKPQPKVVTEKSRAVWEAEL